MGPHPVSWLTVPKMATQYRARPESIRDVCFKRFIAFSSHFASQTKRGSSGGQGGRPLFGLALSVNPLFGKRAMGAPKWRLEILESSKDSGCNDCDVVVTATLVGQRDESTDSDIQIVRSGEFENVVFMNEVGHSVRT